jgi:hydroxycarboxylate dehydrogenase B
MSITIDPQILKEFAVKVFRACGAPEAEAEIIGDHLVTANLMGYDTHGVIRIPQYLNDVRSGMIVPGAPVTVERETETTAVVDCGWNFGQVGGQAAIDIAVEKARTRHVAAVVTRRANHAGRIGTFTQRAANDGMLAIAVCNSPIHGHFVLPWGGTEGRLATNPISFAFPGNASGPILADFSTAESSEGAIRLHRNLGKPLPTGWIVDSSGLPTRDPDDFYGPPPGAILPFGGSKGYRGFALSVLVEVFGGIMGGSSTLVEQPGNGLGFIVVDISAFLPREQFDKLVHEMRDYIKSSPPAPGHEAVLMPGEPDYRNLQRRLHDGIEIDESTWEQIVESAAAIGVRFPPRPAARVAQEPA